MRGRQLDDRFPEQIAELREFGYRDDDIACRLGITVDGLYKRFAKFGIARGRRWRDIEDAHTEAVMTRDEVRAIVGYREVS